MAQKYFVEVDDHGNRYWFRDPEMKTLHRLDGPAIEWPDGSREWWVNGQNHRLDGHAFERTDGYRRWVQNGLLHRLDGPAIEYPNGDVEYWIDGFRYNDHRTFQSRVKELTEPRVREMTMAELEEKLGHPVKIIK